ncbi:tyrosine-type recombinase/integrase [Methylobacterium nodulans]|uniref:Integrase family protein n=1 Tax=Methylobacterium nodulans (strain LMG 21967 / CNCM I-2342 / ORS 2060) TaxID=460265 RepID=B8IHP1_METNO|nr:site-specific integrase [Methylobacterium nodulans]ACL61704.1 integrase family protein [Methylobacterium nodulans ORS 2060]
MAHVCTRYFNEVGQFHATPDTTWWALEWLAHHFGKETLLSEITTERIAEMVAYRRGIRVRRDPETGALREIPSEKVANATVNRYAVEPLRKLFRRARDVWLYQIPYPRWGDLRLSEPQERIREADPDEEHRIVEALGPDYGRLFRFMMATGTRASGALLTWPQIDRRNRVARIRNKAKDGQARWYTIPLTNACLAILDECKGHHPIAVFTYTVARTRDGRTKGERLPITDNGFKTHWRRCIREAGLAEGFRRHDTRHTAGTRYVRATGNLKGAQKLLGHSRIETTTRYAHVLLDDIRAGLEAVEATHTAQSPHIEPHIDAAEGRKSS